MKSEQEINRDKYFRRLKTKQDKYYLHAYNQCFEENNFYEPFVDTLKKNKPNLDLKSCKQDARKQIKNQQHDLLNVGYSQRYNKFLANKNKQLKAKKQKDQIKKLEWLLGG